MYLILLILVRGCRVESMILIGKVESAVVGQIGTHLGVQWHPIGIPIFHKGLDKVAEVVGVDDLFTLHHTVLFDDLRDHQAVANAPMISVTNPAVTDWLGLDQSLLKLDVVDGQVERVEDGVVVVRQAAGNATHDDVDAGKLVFT